MDKYYVSGCKDNGSEIETCDDSEATFWTLYERDEKGLSQGIIDLAFREDAEAAMAVYVERDALQEQVKALAGENSTLTGWIEMDTMTSIDRTSFSATDSVIREIGAKAVEGYSKTVGAEKNGAIYADKLRAGEVS